MRILLDTNILARCVQLNHPQHQPASQAVANLIKRSEELCLVPQVLYEYFVVCTRPEAENGLGMSSAEADDEMTRLLDLFPLTEDSPAIFPLWRQLIQQHAVLGKRGHDARIAAAMMDGEIPAILTFNQRDFRRYPALKILDPAVIAAEQSPL